MISQDVFREYTQYLNDTFDAGGYAAILAWSGLILHWMGVERCRGTIRAMHKGKLPAPFKGKPVIVKKWKAVAEIVKRVAAATR